MAVGRLGASLQATLASGARVLDLLDETPECADVEDGVDVEFCGASMEGVSFSYAGCGRAERILSDITCEFSAGQMVCVSGRSGSGKSTLLKLLMRFWDASEGVVRVSGRDVRRVNTASLRACEACMTQDTHLFTGTLGDNLRVARADATGEHIDAACEAASLDGLIARLPQGYDTPVAELGGSLSSGERQRLGLARVFLSDAWGSASRAGRARRALGPNRGRPVPGVLRAACLCACKDRALPSHGHEDVLLRVPNALLQARHARENPRGHALERPAHAVLSPHPRHPPRPGDPASQEK